MDDALFVPIATASFAAALAALGFFFRQYQEQRLVARRALYNMLNLWEAVVNVCDPPRGAVEAALEEYKHAVKELLGPPAEHVNWDHPDITNKIVPLLADLVTRYRPGISDEIRRNHAGSIESLAERYPLLAFRLNGNDRLRDLFTMLDEYESRSREVLTATEPLVLAQEVVASGQELTRQFINGDVVRQMQRDALSVAWKAGAMQWFRCWMLFRRAQGRPMNDRTKQQMRDAFKKLLREWFPKVVQVTVNARSDQSVQAPAKSPL